MPDPLPLSLADARTAAGLTQAAFGEIVGRSQGAIDKYERGARKTPAQILDLACTALKLSDHDARRLLRWAAQARQEAA